MKVLLLGDSHLARLSPYCRLIAPRCEVRSSASRDGDRYVVTVEPVPLYTVIQLTP